jgi:hypothetical protein
MSKTHAQLFGAAVYKNAVVRIFGVGKQIGEDKYDHYPATNFDVSSDSAWTTESARP